MKCEKCGSVIPGNSKFCLVCGAMLQNEQDEQVTVSETTDSIADEIKLHEMQARLSELSRTGGGNGISRGKSVVLAIGIIVLISIICISAATSQPKSYTTPTQSYSSANNSSYSPSSSYSSSNSSSSSKSYTASEIADTLERGLKKDANGVTYDVYAVGSTLIEVDVIIPGASSAAAKAMLGDAYEWDLSVKSINDLCKGLKSSVDKTGRTDISVSVMLLNDNDTSRMLLNSLDGVTMYDYVNGIDKLG